MSELPAQRCSIDENGWRDGACVGAPRNFRFMSLRSPIRRGIALAGLGSLAGVLLAPAGDMERLGATVLGLIAANPLAWLVCRVLRFLDWVRASRRCQRLQFGLRQMLLLVTACSIAALAWSWLEPYRRMRLEQEEFISAIESLGLPAGPSAYGPAWVGVRQVDTLTFLGAGATDQNLGRLAALPGRKQVVLIDLWSTAISDAAATHLRAFPSLRILHFNCAGITDVALRELRDLPLKSLSLEGTTVSDEGLKFLARMSTLQSLSVAGCSGITDVGLARLRSRTLRTLNVTGTAITEQGLDDFEAQMPQCKVYHHFDRSPQKRRS